jgi:hypothetical protein
MYADITEKLRDLGCIPLSSATLDGLLANFRSQKDKVSCMVKQGELVRIKRGLYCVSQRITGQRLSNELIANHLYGPSYVSLEKALVYHNLIPERVEVTQSVVIKRAKKFQTTLGSFTYMTVPVNYYSIGINQEQTSTGQTFLIASPEKALCDLILLRPNLRIVSEKSMRVFLKEYMRVDLHEISNPDMNILDQCIATGRKGTELLCLRKVIENECL